MAAHGLVGGLWWFIVVLVVVPVTSHETPCSEGNHNSCLNEVRKYFGSEDWWFGSSYSTECPDVQGVTSFKCHNPSTYKTIAARLLQREDFDVNGVEQVLRIRYFAPGGGYYACNHWFSVPEVTMTSDVDSLHAMFYDSWSLTFRPAVIWQATPGVEYSLVVYDVGAMRLCGLWVNIAGGDSAMGQEVVPYSGPMNPIYRKAFLVFALFKQNETISDVHQQSLKEKHRETISEPFLLTTAFSELGHRIHDPMALGYVTIWTDPFSIQTYKDRGVVNNCPFMAARHPTLTKVMDGFNLTTRFKTSSDYRGPYFSDLDVEVDIFYWSEAISYNVCCIHQMEQEMEFKIDPLSSKTISPVYLRRGPDLHLNAIHSLDRTFFWGKYFSVVLLDVTDAYNTKNSTVTSVLWLATDHMGLFFPGNGKVHQDYVTPTPPLDERRLFMFLVFRQGELLRDSFVFEDFCKNGQIEGCNFDLHKFVSTHNLHFSGVNWFWSKGDLYTRMKMYESDPTIKDELCNEVAGYRYGDPCPINPIPETTPGKPTEAPPVTSDPNGSTARVTPEVTPQQTQGTTVSSGHIQAPFAYSCLSLVTLLAISTRFVLY